MVGAREVRIDLDGRAGSGEAAAEPQTPDSSDAASRRRLAVGPARMLD